MAKLDIDLSDAFMSLESLWNSNEQQRAVQLAARHLRDDAVLSSHYRNLVALMLESVFEDKTNRSRKQKTGRRPGPKGAATPRNVLEIGSEYEAMISEGMSGAEAELKLANKYKASPRTIQRRVKDFRAAKKVEKD